MKFSIKDFFSKYDQIWSHLLNKSLMENFSFCAVIQPFGAEILKYAQQVPEKVSRL